MKFFSSAPAMIMLAAIVLLHILSIVLDGIWAKITISVNIALHIALFLVLIIAKIPLDETVTLYMMSVLVYVLSAFLKRRLEGRSDK